MDQAIVDREPAPVTLTEQIEMLEIGQSLLDPSRSRGTMATIGSKVQARFPGRRYRTTLTSHGPRIWRLA